MEQIIEKLSAMTTDAVVSMLKMLVSRDDDGAVEVFGCALQVLETRMETREFVEFCAEIEENL